MPHFTLTAPRQTKKDIEATLKAHGNITPEFFERSSVCVEAEASVIEAFSKANPSWTAYELASITFDTEESEPELPSVILDAHDVKPVTPKKFWNRFGL